MDSLPLRLYSCFYFYCGYMYFCLSKSTKRPEGGYPLDNPLSLLASDKCQLSCRTVAQLAYTLCLGQLYGFRLYRLGFFELVAFVGWWVISFCLFLAILLGAAECNNLIPMRIVGEGFHALPNKIKKIRKDFVPNYSLFSFLFLKR